MSVTFRSQLVLMVIAEYGFGDHVLDRRAFVLRCAKSMSDRWLPQRLLRRLVVKGGGDGV